jgi:hypothetical protein
MKNVSTERFCNKFSVRVQVGSNSTLVYSPTDRATKILPIKLALLLDRCRDFRTLEQHAISCAGLLERRGHGSQSSSIETINSHLADFARSGLLISESDFLAACRSTNDAPLGITTVGVITRNRTENMDRCLRSYIENCKKYGRTDDFVVMDDSQAPLTRARNKERLASLKREYDGHISYGGLEEKRRFAKLLVSEGAFDPSLVDFSLIDAGDYEFSCGKNRNALFLQTVGDLIFSTDDDAVCQIVAPPRSEFEYEQEPRGQPLTPIEFWFFADREETLRFADFVKEDLLAAHEQFLGKRLGDCLASFDNVRVLSLDRSVSHHLKSFESGKDRILVTLTGMVGDSGIRVPVTHRILNRASRQRLIESREAYLTGRSSREVLRVATAPSISTRTWFVSTALAFDNRDLLPPFFPVLRGTDGVFSATLGRCFEYGYVADVPRAILHVPNRSGTYDRDAVMQSARGITMHSLIIACLNTRRFWLGQDDNAERLKALGKHFVEIGSMDLGDFEEFVRIQLWREQANAMANLERDFLDYDDPPGYWAHDLREYMTEMRMAFTKADYVVPTDLRGNRSLEQARKLSRELVFKFGQLLYCWPDIVAVARSLRTKGEGLATPV